VGEEYRTYKKEREKKKANWIGHILRRNCLLKHVIERKLQGRIEMTGRRGRRRKQLLNNLKKTRGSWRFKEEVLDRTVWITCFGRDYGPVERQHCEPYQQRFKKNTVVKETLYFSFSTLLKLQEQGI
jgi:hypothetical protein